MVVNNSIERLMDLGFSEYEARTYPALLAIQPATAYEIAREAGIPTSKIYQVIGSGKYQVLYCWRKICLKEPARATLLDPTKERGAPYFSRSSVERAGGDRLSRFAASGRYSTFLKPAALKSSTWGLR